MDGIVVSIYIILKFLLTTLSVLISWSFRNPRVKSNSSFPLAGLIFPKKQDDSKNKYHIPWWWNRQMMTKWKEVKVKNLLFSKYFLVTNDQLKKQNQRKMSNFPPLHALKNPTSWGSPFKVRHWGMFSCETTNLLKARTPFDKNFDKVKSEAWPCKSVS